MLNQRTKPLPSRKQTAVACPIVRATVRSHLWVASVRDCIAAHAFRGTRRARLRLGAAAMPLESIARGGRAGPPSRCEPPQKYYQVPLASAGNTGPECRECDQPAAPTRQEIRDASAGPKLVVLGHADGALAQWQANRARVVTLQSRVEAVRYRCLPRYSCATLRCALLTGAVERLPQAAAADPPCADI